MRSYFPLFAAFSLLSCSGSADVQPDSSFDQFAWPVRDQQPSQDQQSLRDRQTSQDQRDTPVDGGSGPKPPSQMGDTSTGVGADVDTFSWDHEIPNTGDGGRLLLVMTGARGGAEITSVKYGAADLTLLRTDVTTVPDARTEIWYLTDPSLGTDTITIALNKKQNITGGATAWLGVDTADPFVGTGAGAEISAPTTDTDISLDVPSEPGARVVDVITVQTPDANLDADSAQTELWTLSTEHLETHSSTRASAGSHTEMKWTQTGTGISGNYEPYTISAVSIRRE